MYPLLVSQEGLPLPLVMVAHVSDFPSKIAACTLPSSARGQDILGTDFLSVAFPLNPPTHLSAGSKTSHGRFISFSPASELSASWPGSSSPPPFPPSLVITRDLETKGLVRGYTRANQPGWPLLQSQE